MKKIIIIFASIAAIILIILTAAFIYLKLNATTIVNKRLKAVLPQARIGKIEIKYPFTLKLHQIELDKIAEIKKVSLSLNIVGLLSKKIIVNRLEVIKPNINIVKEKDGSFNILSLKPAVSKKKDAERIKKKSELSIIIINLAVKQGTIHVTDRSQEKESRLSVDDLNLTISNLVFPDLSKTNFKGECKLAMDKGKAKIDANGWIDIMDKSMDGTITISDANLIYFNRYFSFLLLEDFTSANLNALIRLTALDNDLNIACHLELYNLLLKEKQTDNLSVLQSAIGNVQDIGDNALSILFSVLKPRGNRIELDFAVKTKLNTPILNETVFKEAVIKEVKKKMAKLPLDIVKGRAENILEGIKDEIGDVGVDTIKDTFKNLKKMFR